MRMLLALAVETAGCLVDWIFMEISDRDPIPMWDFQEPGARLRPWLRELSFWRHDTSTPVNKQGVKLYKAFAPRNDWSELGRSIFGGSNLFGSRV